MKNIKVFVSLFLVLYCLSFIYSEISYAHSPERIEIKFVGSLLKIKVFHNVGNTKMHYVKYINVYVNGQWVAKQRFFSQQYDGYQEAVFNVPDLKAKDVLLVIAHCSRKGRIDKSMIAPN
ncbi:MAG: hypothetical protein P9X27_03170 [Candidatus Kaelpia aquatica]|nr:hypothetical protein [Candidatus Kaelpia aquatica]